MNYNTSAKEFADFAAVTSRLHEALRRDVSSTFKESLREGRRSPAFYFWPSWSSTSKHTVASRITFYMTESDNDEKGALSSVACALMKSAWLKAYLCDESEMMWRKSAVLSLCVLLFSCNTCFLSLCDDSQGSNFCTSVYFRHFYVGGEWNASFGIKISLIIHGGWRWHWHTVIGKCRISFHIGASSANRSSTICWWRVTERQKEKDQWETNTVQVKQPWCWPVKTSKPGQNDPRMFEFLI